MMRAMADGVSKPRRVMHRTGPPSSWLGPMERAVRGKALRGVASRASHGIYEPAPERPDPITLLEQQAATRVPELVPIRYGRMADSPFTFFRGAARIMASDLAATPKTGIVVQCCGDAHLSNFGAFASRDRRLVFNINDFDETLPGPWEWDVKRLAASMLIAARNNGFSQAEQHRAVLYTVGAYRRSMADFARQRNLDVWYRRTELDEVLVELQSRMGRTERKRAARSVAKARTRDHLQAFSKLTEPDGDGARFASNPPLIVPLRDFGDARRGDLEGRMRAILGRYRTTLQHDRRVLLDQFSLVDVARRVVGVGSVGTDAWMALFLGRDRDDPLVLQIKEAQASVLEEFTGASPHRHPGQRVVVGQRTIQTTPDIFLGWLSVTRTMSGDSREYYVRQLRDWKGSAEVETMRPQGLALYGELCGGTLARAHARSGDRIAIAAYLGSGDAFARALLAFSEAYADQNDRDYAALLDAIASGRIEAQEGV
jgi:uncharacterized protein (DUF2252 family)